MKNISNIRIEQNTVRIILDRKFPRKIRFSLLFFTLLEKTLDEKCMESIEISEDAIGDEVYYNYLKMGRKLIDDMVLDEEQM